MTIKCPVCSSNAETLPPTGFGGEQINCPRCGEYRISSTAESMLSNALSGDAKRIANACGWIRQHQNVLISSETVGIIEDLPTPRLPVRALHLLEHLEAKTLFLGDRLGISHTNCMDFLGISNVCNVSELVYLVDFLSTEGHVVIHSRTGNSLTVSITPSGYSYLEQSRYSNVESQLGFCAMWFDSSMKAIWSDAISPAILAAGYEPKRIDEHPHNNRIDDEITAMIRRSKFVVADFTGQRGGVYFEAGFALGMKLPVIWTVKKSELPSVHFDNRQYNFVTWEEDRLSEFHLDLQYRIEATLGRGKYKPS